VGLEALERGMRLLGRIIVTSSVFSPRINAHTSLYPSTVASCPPTSSMASVASNLPIALQHCCGKIYGWNGRLHG
jgi:hypothetical protein